MNGYVIQLNEVVMHNERNAWNKPVNKGPPVLWVVVALFLAMFFLGICQEVDSVYGHTEPMEFVP